MNVKTNFIRCYFILMSSYRELWIPNFPQNLKNTRDMGLFL